jgi:N-ethylmaleimide reductase
MPESFRRAVRDTFKGAIIYAGRYNAESGAKLLDSGLADFVAFGRPFMANPDLPARIANDWPLNALNPATVYGGTGEGYVDYPVYGG